MKKYVIGICIAVCFLAAGERFAKQYRRYMPYASVGKCLGAADDPQRSRFHIMENNNKRGVSTGIVDFEFMGARMMIPGSIPYEEQRKRNLIEVPCHDEEII